MHFTGWDWIFFIILAVIALVVCLFALIMSFVLAIEAKYFGLPKNNVWATILAVVIAPLTIIFLSLVLSGVIPSIFDPRFI